MGSNTTVSENRPEESDLSVAPVSLEREQLQSTLHVLVGSSGMKLSQNAAASKETTPYDRNSTPTQAIQPRL